MWYTIYGWRTIQPWIIQLQDYSTRTIQLRLFYPSVKTQLHFTQIFYWLNEVKKSLIKFFLRLHSGCWSQTFSVSMIQFFGCLCAQFSHLAYIQSCYFLYQAGFKLIVAWDTLQFIKKGQVVCIREQGSSLQKLLLLHYMPVYVWLPHCHILGQ